MGFFDDLKELGLGYALDSARAKAQYKCDVALFRAEVKRASKKLEDDLSEHPELNTDDFDMPKKIKIKDFIKKKEAAEEAEGAELPPMTLVTDEEMKEALKAAMLDDVPKFGMMSADDIANNIDEATTALSDIDSRKVKLTILAMLYEACFVRSENIFRELDPNTNDDLEFVNSICYMFSGLPFCSTSAKVVPIDNLFDDMNQLRRIVEFEHAYKDLGSSAEIDEMYEKVRDVITEENRKESSDPIVPIMFTNSHMNLYQSKGLNKREVENLEKKFGDLLTPYAHQFNRINDLLELVIYGNGRMDSYLIDPGHVFGNGMNILITVFGSMFPVSIDEKTIISKLLENPANANLLTQKEMTKITSKLMPDYRIYANVDMSRGEEILPKLNRNQYNELVRKLYTIVNLPWGQKQDRPMMPRMRFRSFKNENDFILASDDKVKVPSIAGFNGFLYPMTIIVKGDTAHVKFNMNDKEHDLVVDLGVKEQAAVDKAAS